MGTLNEIGGYKLVAQMSESTASAVFKGFDEKRQRPVLIKSLKAAYRIDPELVHRLEEEADIVARIKHANVVSLYDERRPRQAGFVALEFVDGMDLRQLLASTKLPPELAWYVLREVTLGLQAAHKKGILHLDIKPSNILISNSGQVKLTDFGLSDSGEASPWDQTKWTRGTVQYFAPEQILGEAVGPHTDVFALGATFYEMLTGERAFFGDDESQMFQSILGDEPTHYLSKMEGLPARLAELCERMLAKKVSDRFTDCREVLRALDTFRNSFSFDADRDTLVAFLESPETFQSKLVEKEDARSAGSRRQRMARRAGYAVLVMMALSVFAYWGLFPEEESVDMPATGVQSLPTSSPEALQTGAEAASAPSSNGVITPPADRPVVPPKQARVQEKEQPRPGAPNQRQISGSTPEVTRSVEVAPGKLFITCAPWAYVFVDGDSVGTTPLLAPLELGAGEHSVVLKNPGFPAYSRTVNVDSGENATFDFSFWSIVGKVALTVSPWAKVYIDHEYIDTVPPQKEPYILPPGQHVLTLEHPVLGTWETTFQAEADKTLDLQFNLRTLLSR